MSDRQETFDLQAHRGGAGLWPENTLEAFGQALALGVSTLELDVHLTAEDDVVVAHDPTLADARTIRTLTRADLPPTMPLLCQVGALLQERGADPVGINLEIKYDAVAAASREAGTVTAREDFVEVVAAAIRIDGLVARTSIQCFDWGVLALVGTVEPGLRRNVLASDHYLQPGQPGASPWLAGLDIDDVPGGLAQAAAEAGFDAISPVHGITDEVLVEAAHDVGLAVIPYTVDDLATMRTLVGIGVDGLITNHPDRLRAVLAEQGRPLPPAYPAP